MTAPTTQDQLFTLPRPDLPKLPPEVEVLRPQFLQMMMEIVFAELHIGRWRARTSLNLDDLGLATRDQKELKAEFGDLVDIGDKMLLPPVPEWSEFFDKGKPKRTYAQVLLSIEQTARWYLDSRSKRLQWGHGVQLTALDDFEEGIREYQTSYFKVRDELCGDTQVWRGHVNRLQETYRQFALESARRKQMLTTDQAVDVEIFIAEMWRTISGLIPSQKQFYDSFYFNVEYKFVDVAPWIDSETQLRMWDKIRKDPATEAQARAYETIFEKRRQILDKQNSEMEIIRDQFLADVKRQLSEIVYNVCVEILESMEKQGGELIGRSSVKLANLMKILERDSFTIDADAKQMADRVRALILMDKDRTAKDVRDTLRDIAIVSRSTLLALEETPRSARDFGIPDDIQFETVRRARVALQMDLPEIQIEPETRGRTIRAL